MMYGRYTGGPGLQQVTLKEQQFLLFESLMQSGVSIKVNYIIACFLSQPQSEMTTEIIVVLH